MLSNGDALGVYGKNFFGKFTKLTQKLGGLGKLSGITHVGIAREINGIWYSQEMDGKHNVLRPISQYLEDDIKIEVYRANSVYILHKLPKEYENINKVLDHYITNPITYNLFDLLKIGFQVIFRFKRNGKEEKDNMVCSGYSAAILESLGWVPPKDLSNMPSPAQLCKALEYIETL